MMRIVLIAIGLGCLGAAATWKFFKESSVCALCGVRAWESDLMPAREGEKICRVPCSPKRVERVPMEGLEWPW